MQIRQYSIKKVEESLFFTGMKRAEGTGVNMCSMSSPVLVLSSNSSRAVYPLYVRTNPPLQGYFVGPQSTPNTPSPLRGNTPLRAYQAPNWRKITHGHYVRPLHHHSSERIRNETRKCAYMVCFHSRVDKANGIEWLGCEILDKKRTR